MPDELPDNPEEFSVAVMLIINESWPNLDVSYVKPFALAVEGRRLDLKNLYRMVQYDKERGYEIVNRFVESLFFAGEDKHEEQIHEFIDIEDKILPRVYHESIFESLDKELMVWTPWVNDCVIGYVIDFPKMTMSIARDQLDSWGVEIDDIDFLARKNLSRMSESIELSVYEVAGGRVALMNVEDGYDASRILLDDIHGIISPLFDHENFYVGVPARDMFVAFPAVSESKELILRVLDRMKSEYVNLPYPITPNAFYVCQDGVCSGYPHKDL